MKILSCVAAAGLTRIVLESTPLREGAEVERDRASGVVGQVGEGGDAVDDRHGGCARQRPQACRFGRGCDRCGIVAGFDVSELVFLVDDWLSREGGAGGSGGRGLGKDH